MYNVMFKCNQWANEENDKSANYVFSCTSIIENKKTKEIKTNTKHFVNVNSIEEGNIIAGIEALNYIMSSEFFISSHDQINFMLLSPLLNNFFDQNRKSLIKDKRLLKGLNVLLANIKLHQSKGRNIIIKNAYSDLSFCHLLKLVLDEDAKVYNFFTKLSKTDREIAAFSKKLNKVEQEIAKLKIQKETELINRNRMTSSLVAKLDRTSSVDGFIARKESEEFEYKLKIKQLVDYKECNSDNYYFRKHRHNYF